MAPLLLELQRRSEIESICCLTAQHREMLDTVMELFGLQAQFDLNIMEPGQTLHSITTKALLGLDRVLQEARPDLVLVHGDTSSTFSGALAAFYLKIPVGHVEAGLRSYDIYSPYPEEMNRKLTGQIAALQFAPTAQNADNLRREGIEEGVFVTGNTVIDAMGYTVDRFSGVFGSEIDAIDWDNRRVIALTCHRRENLGAPMAAIFSAVKTLVSRHRDVELVYPVHLSPAVREAAYSILGGVERVHLIEPLDPIQMHGLMARSYLVMTDSGGIQEEAPALGKPVLVLRRETERPEAIAAGTARLAGVERDEIIRLGELLLADSGAYAEMAQAVNPYGDGGASARIADSILWHFGYREAPPADFCP